ncbi:hypothetical protein L3X38_012124 [Prunus dulcis]|uniref:Uncharacterized protein n=1 Tax=Prunus dulcis TaxID=3755 RepID=A0AAD4WL04_PRUDU|nr:hypothetical protein L3X38_012124 [Prunus dulcis]
MSDQRRDPLRFPGNSGAGPVIIVLLSLPLYLEQGVFTERAIDVLLVVEKSHRSPSFTSVVVVLHVRLFLLGFQFIGDRSVVDDSITVRETITMSSLKSTAPRLLKSGNLSLSGSLTPRSVSLPPLVLLLAKGIAVQKSFFYSIICSTSTSYCNLVV